MSDKYLQADLFDIAKKLTRLEAEFLRKPDDEELEEVYESMEPNSIIWTDEMEQEYYEEVAQQADKEMAEIDRMENE